MSILHPPLYFRYLSKLYLRNLIAILMGLAFAFAAMDYFQYAQELKVAWNYKILYLYYMWQQALGLLYPLAIIFALIMTKFSLIKHNNMAILHAFGYGEKRLLIPFFFWATVVYGIFVLLNTTEFAYARDKGAALLKHEIGAYDVNDLFFKYNDTFVYMKKLDPIHKRLEDITIFKVKDYRVRYTIHAAYATFDGEEWDAVDTIRKTHIYQKGRLIRYEMEHKDHIKTLKGYKPKIIESLYEGKALNIVDAYHTWQLLKVQGLDSQKIRAVLYEKTVMPLFALAMVIILFFKLPYHARMMRVGLTVAIALGATFVAWGLLFGLYQIGANGVVEPEWTAIFPVVLLWIYALYIFFTDERRIG